MEEIAHAEQHGWQWRPAEEFASDPHDRIIELANAGDPPVQKVTRGGIVVAFIRPAEAGEQILLPPAAQLDSGDEE